MSNIRHSLSSKLIGLVLLQNGIVASLLFSMAEDVTSAETIAIVGFVLVAGLITAALAGRIVGTLKDLSSDLPGLSAGQKPIAPEHLERADEIGTIARELERLSRDNLALLIEDDHERDRRSREEAARDEQHTQELDAAIGTALTLRTTLDAVDRATRRFAAGDLSCPRS